MSVPDPETSGNPAKGPSATATVVRRRLLDLLHDLRPLTTVCAPAGYGKTTLVESWATQRPHPGLTLVQSALDDHDLHPRTFWRSSIDALAAAGVDVAEAVTTPEMQTTGPDAPRQLARCIASHADRVAWILDCGELDLPPNLGVALDRLLRRSEGNLALVLLTRSDPPLPLHSLRLRGELTEIRAVDLAFSATEVAALLQRHGVDLDPVDVSALRTRTSGWPAGLRFAAMSLGARWDPTAAIREFRGDTGNVAAYLMTEVLARQTPRMREFLLRSCIADRLHPPLVEALTGHSCNPQLLQEMADGNCFIEQVPGLHEQYRYHPLFRQFLRTRLSFEDPVLALELHGIAAAWLARHGQTSAAVRHAVAARAWPLALRLLVESGCWSTVLLSRDSEELRTLLTDLPSNFEGSDAAIIRATVALSELDADTAASQLAQARSALGDESPDRASAARLPIAILEAVLASLQADPEIGLWAALSGERSVRLSPPSDLAEHRRVVAIIAGCKGRVLFERGDLSDASAAFAEGARAARDGHHEGPLGELTGMQALVEAVEGRLKRASDLALQVEPPPASTTHGRTAVPGSEAASLALAWARSDESRAPAAHDLLDRAQEQRVSYDSRVLRSVLVLLRARSLRARGHLGIALASLRAERGAPCSAGPTAPPSGWLESALLVAESEVLTALGRQDDAIALLRQSPHPSDVASEVALQRALLTSPDAHPDMARLLRLSDAPALLTTRIDRSLLLAEHSLEEGEPAEAEQLLEQGLRLAAAEGLRRPFREAGPGVRRRLRDRAAARRDLWLQTPWDGPSRDAAPVRIPAQRAAPARDGSVVAPMVGHPTSKEMEVLGHLAELLTTEEIAALMFVSINTIRSHVRSILRKLGVTRRNDAVRRAWDLDLLVRGGEDPYRRAR